MVIGGLYRPKIQHPFFAGLCRGKVENIQYAVFSMKEKDILLLVSHDHIEKDQMYVLTFLSHNGIIHISWSYSARVGDSYATRVGCEKASLNYIDSVMGSLQP